mmetsp:Transcript_4008/g.7351  ORF Transcript_4008/g.7351 Transcript_4008/m.7351 type:complete len:763 (+) Transcript_4008:662-2950(+)
MSPVNMVYLLADHLLKVAPIRLLRERPSEYQRDNSHQLHDDVEGRSGGVLQRVADGVTDDGGVVLVSLLSLDNAVGVSEESSTDELLGVIPGASGVGSRDSHGHSGSQSSEEHTGEHLNSEEEANNQRGQKHKSTRGDHFLEGSVSSDGNALGVVLVRGLKGVRVGSSDSLAEAFFKLFLFVFESFGEFLNLFAEGFGVVLLLGLGSGSLEEVGDLRFEVGDSVLFIVHLRITAVARSTLFGDLAADFHNHLIRSHTNGLHRHREEPVRNHSSNNESSELPSSNQLKFVNADSIRKRAEKSQGDQGSTSDSKTLSDGSSSVTGGIELVGVLAHVLRHASHLGNTSGIVGDWSVCVDGEASGESHQDAQGAAGYAEHATEGVADEHSDCQADDRNDSRLVAEGETVDDVGGRASFARGGDLLSGAVAVRGVVLGNETNDQAGPEANADADSGGVPVDGLAADVEVMGKEASRNSPNERSGDSGGHKQLDLEASLDISIFLDGSDVSGDEAGEEARKEACNADQDREVHRGVVNSQVLALSTEDESSARGLSERTEEVGSHSRDVSDIVTDVVSDNSRVARIIFFPALVYLSGEVGSNVGGFGVDTSTNTPEHSNGGASKTIAGDALVHSDGTGLAVVVVVVGAEEEFPVDLNEDHEDHDRHGDESEAHDGSSLKSCGEARADTFVRLDGGTRVGEYGNSHTDKSRNDGSNASDPKGNQSSDSGSPVADTTKNKKNDGSEEDHEDKHVQVFTEQERISSIGDQA